MKQYEDECYNSKTVTGGCLSIILFWGLIAAAYFLLCGCTTTRKTTTSVVEAENRIETNAIGAYTYDQLTSMLASADIDRDITIALYDTTERPSGQPQRKLADIHVREKANHIVEATKMVNTEGEASTTQHLETIDRQEQTAEKDTESSMQRVYFAVSMTIAIVIFCVGMRT